MAEPRELAFGIDSWYPVVRGGTAPKHVVIAGDPKGPAKVQAIWSALADGERLVLHAGAQATGGRVPLAKLESALEGKGTPERFVVFPGTGGSFTLLPTRDGAALRGGMPLLPTGRARGRLLWGLLRSLSPLGVAQRLGRPEVAIWTKGIGAASDDLAALPVGGAIAVAAGVPDRNQKVIVRALDRRGNARAVLKIGFSERTDDAVTREAAALERLAELIPHRAPRLIAAGERAGRSWMAQEVLSGRHAGDALSVEHGAFLTELGEIGQGECALEHLPIFRDSVRNLTALEPGFDPDWYAEYMRLRAALEETTDDAPIPTTIAHGDFTPWNLVRSRREIRAYDWEYFAEAAPALYDLVHYHVQTSVLVRQFTGERIFDSFDSYFAGPAKDVVRALGLDGVDVLRAIGLYILHEGTTAEVQERMRPAPFAQATWLRRARLALCERIAGLLRERRIPRWASNAAGPPNSGRPGSGPSNIDGRSAA